MYSVTDTHLMVSGFPHSEISGSKSVCRLPEAYRRLPRLSSPLTAKASTVCAYSLDHITPSNRETVWSQSVKKMTFAENLRLNSQIYLDLTTRSETCVSSLLLSLSEFLKNVWRKDQKSGLSRKHSFLSLGIESYWWSQGGSNS